VSEASPAALAVWDVLAENARQKPGWSTATELMRQTGLSRPEINAWLRELAASRWAQRAVHEQYGRYVEAWRAPVFDASDAGRLSDGGPDRSVRTSGGTTGYGTSISGAPPRYTGPGHLLRYLYRFRRLLGCQDNRWKPERRPRGVMAGSRRILPGICQKLPSLCM
jgi:hypothetical protein